MTIASGRESNPGNPWVADGQIWAPYAAAENIEATSANFTETPKSLKRVLAPIARRLPVSGARQCAAPAAPES